MTVKVVLVLLQRKAITQLQDLRRKRKKVVFGAQRKKHSDRNRAGIIDDFYRLNSSIYNCILCC
jgi:hypothetical protein